MKKFDVFLIGRRIVLANNQDEAMKSVEEELKVVHTNFNIEISGIKEREINE